MPASRSDIIDAYQELLGRPPESEAVIAEQARHGDPAALRAAIAASAEYAARTRRLAGLARLAQAPPPAPRAPGPPRLLLFGAYGNGNLGDQAQPAALARLLAAALPAGTRIAATAWEDHAPYDPTRALAQPADLILDPAGLAGFDTLVIGGGGMLGPAHFPLTEPAWIDWLRGSGLRYGFAGIGVVPEATMAHPALHDLFAGAAFIGLRDTGAPWLAEAMAGQPGDWFEMPDPVLAEGLLRAPQPRPPEPGCETLLILKRPAPGHAEEARLLAEAAAFAAAAPGACRALLLEPALDAPALADFPIPVAPAPSLARLRDECQGAGRIVSMRYHGVIAAALAGRPVLGGTAPKAAFLAGALYGPAAALWAAGDLAARLAALPPASPDAEALAGLRARSAAGIERIATAIMQGRD